MNRDGSESVESRAEDEIAELLRAAGWRVDHRPAGAGSGADLILTQKKLTYVAEVKATSEGRPDRVIALLAQAILQAQAYARDVPKAQPLALIWVAQASPALLRKVDDFRSRFAPDIAMGVVSGNGARHFAGSGLAELNTAPSPARKALLSPPRHTSNLFSDLNQWMLKVLLAPDVPEHLLTAPRNTYRNVSELAAAADVSVMSAFRFATRLREEGFLDESGGYLRLVRRSELFRRWQSTATQSSPETRMRFLIPATGPAQLHKWVSRHRACLGLFAAADALGLGHVSGVPPYVHVSRISQSEQQTWKELIPTAPGEQPHLIIKQALTPQSLFRGAVTADEMRVADVLQVWLDVSSHPSRGTEQAELLRRKVLQGIIGEAE